MLAPIVTQNAALICLVADWDGDAAPTVVDLAKRLERDKDNTRKTVNLLKSEGVLTYSAAEGVGVTDAGRDQVPALRVVTGEREVDPNALQLIASRLMPHPLNPRTTFAPEEIEALAEAIAEGGLLQNLTVRAMDPPGLATSHWIVAGERRWRAIRLLIDRKDPRWPTDRKIRCQLVDIDDQQHLILATIENIARVDLNKIEEAKNFAALEATGLRPSQIAKKIGKTPRHVQRRLQLLTCEPHIQDQVAAGDMSVEAALATVQEKKPEVAAAEDGDPCVFDGRTYPNATLATEARRLAEGGGPSGSGSRPVRPPHPDEATDNSISPAQALLLGEVQCKQIRDATWIKGLGHVVVLDEDAPADLREQLRPMLWGGYLAHGQLGDGTGRHYLRATDSTAEYLRKLHKFPHHSFDALRHLRFAIGARPNTGCHYVTPWLNYSAALDQWTNGADPMIAPTDPADPGAIGGHFESVADLRTATGVEPVETATEGLLGPLTSDERPAPLFALYPGDIVHTGGASTYRLLDMPESTGPRTIFRVQPILKGKDFGGTRALDLREIHGLAR
jgi:ParB/RepB/Spo0J family partition protein